MDNMGMRWETEHGEFSITPGTLEWIMNNVQTSRYNENRCYVYNKALARYYDNNNPNKTLADLHAYDVNGEHPRTGALAPTGAREEAKKEKDCGCGEIDKSDWNIFDYIRDWADRRGLYEEGDVKTQYVKLMEEAGEVGRAILKEDQEQIVDGIGDMVVVLTNLAALAGLNIEDCIEEAYSVIENRTGKMENGTFKKD